VKEKSQFPPGRDPLAHAPSVAIAPPVRCFHRALSSPSFPCGQLARWLRRGNHWFADEYFCDEHRAPADLEIPAVHPFRRVRINVDVHMAGVHVNAPLAHTEAIVKLEAALQAIGAIGDVVTVRSDLVKSSGLALPLPSNRRHDDPE
jgi:hypothetical protein